MMSLCPNGVWRGGLLTLFGMIVDTLLLRADPKPLLSLLFDQRFILADVDLSLFELFARGKEGQW